MEKVDQFRFASAPASASATAGAYRAASVPAEVAGRASHAQGRDAWAILHFDAELFRQPVAVAEPGSVEELECATAELPATLPPGSIAIVRRISPASAAKAAERVPFLEARSGARTDRWRSKRGLPPTRAGSSTASGVTLTTNPSCETAVAWPASAFAGRLAATSETPRSRASRQQHRVRPLRQQRRRGRAASGARPAAARSRRRRRRRCRRSRKRGRRRRWRTSAPPAAEGSPPPGGGRRRELLIATDDPLRRDAQHGAAGREGMFAEELREGLPGRSGIGGCAGSGSGGHEFGDSANVPASALQSARASLQRSSRARLSHGDAEHRPASASAGPARPGIHRIVEDRSFKCDPSVCYPEVKNVNVERDRDVNSDLLSNTPLSPLTFYVFPFLLVLIASRRPVQFPIRRCQVHCPSAASRGCPGRAASLRR